MTAPQEKVDFQEILGEYRARLAQEVEKTIVLECRMKARDQRIVELEAQVTELERT